MSITAVDWPSLGRLLFAVYLLEYAAGGALSFFQAKRLLRRGGRLEDRTELATQALVLVFFVALATTESLLPPTSHPRVSAACLAVLGCGQLLSAWAAWSLGGRWCRRIITLPGAPPVASGPYAFLRHPIYTATVMEWFALPGVGGYLWFGVPAAAAAALVLHGRAKAEEQSLRAKFES